MEPSSATIKDGKVEVFTFKRGVLSRLAHDLRLCLRRFEITVAGSRVSATFWPDSLEVMGVERDGQTDAQVLGPAQRSEIQGNIRNHILLLQKHPTISFTGTVEASPAGARVRGDLEMVGRSLPLDIPVDIRSERASGEVVLQPTRWGIAPFRALMGAIQLEDRVVVRFDLPVPPSISPA